MGRRYCRGVLVCRVLKEIMKICFALNVSKIGNLFLPAKFLGENK